MTSENVRMMIRKLIEEELDTLDEMSTSDGAGAYLTKGAFSGNSTARRRSNAQKLGYKLTPRGEEDLRRTGDKLMENKTPYHEWKKDPKHTPQVKIATAISELSKNLELIERMLRRSGRLQTELSIPSEALYRRTQNAMVKLESRLIRLVEQLRNIRGK